MKYVSDADRHYIENKYHKQNEPFDPFRRFDYHGDECDASTGLDDGEMEKGLEKIWQDKRGEHHALVKAHSFAFVLDNARLSAPREDYFFCFYNWTRPLNRPIISRWMKEVFSEMPDVDDTMQSFAASGTAELWLDTDHVVPYWEDIFALGFKGLLERSEEKRRKRETLTPDEDAFFESIKIEYEAILRLISRIALLTESVGGEKSTLIVESLRSLERGAPTNTFEALLTAYIFHLASESVDQYQVRSLGNGLDRSLWRFYKGDLDSGRFTREDIKRFLSYFFLQFSAIGNYWGQPFYLACTAPDTTTPTTDLTLDILDAYDSLDIYNPKIQIKISPETDEEIVRRALTMIREGHSSIVFCCIPGITKSLMSAYGVSEEEAKNCDISGCNEMHVRGREACMISSLPNAAKAVTYVFNNGLDTVTGKKLGLETGEVEEFKTFDEFYTAFIAQLTHIADTVIGTARRYEHHVARVNPSVMLSATVESSLDSALDAYAFGVKYPTSCLLLCSLATAVDSVLAVKELVFEKRLTTLAELKRALMANWEGYDDLRHKCLSAEHKYGNGDPVADLWAAAIFRYFSTYVTGRKNSRGGVYKVGVPSTLHFIKYGRLTEATPDGRKMGEECSKNVAPVIGMERRGVTAMIRSALSLQPWLFSEAFVLDVMLHPSAVEGEEGLVAMKGLVDTYMKNDGISIQFNVFSAETLRDAQSHPEKYENLQVRVSGWNVRWNDLSRDAQNAYIRRAESFGK